MDILVKLNDVEESLKQLETNNKYFIIKDNLFSMDKIVTLKSPNDKIGSICTTSKFEFSYNDGCTNEVISIEYVHENTDCISFVRTCKIISESEIDLIFEKAKNIISERRDKSELIKSDEIDNIFYNEVLVYISSKINETDKSDLKDDFISKYEMYKEKKQTIINNTKEAINNLYCKIINAKLAGE